MKKTIPTISLATLFHFLTWGQGLGLNLLIFSLVTSGLIAWLKPEISRRPMVWVLLTGWCISALFVLIHHSLLSIAVFWVFLFVLVGYLQATEVRFWAVGLVESLRGVFGGWLISIRQLGNSGSNDQDWHNTWRQIRLWVLPIAILIPFYFIYSNANSTLGTINSWLDQRLAQLFQVKFNWGRLIVFLLSWALVVAILGQRSGLSFLHNMVKDWQFPLMRSRIPSLFQTSKSIGLKYEYQMATYTFLILNGLLLLVNTFELIEIWFSPQENTAVELSRYVHESTWLLIFSILLAMLVVLLFMRKNLNFYPNNHPLKQLALLWLAQNAFLALSVGIRNGHYIHQYGLAHGRIVVIFFLALVLFGLYTMHLKIKGPLTTFYLLEMNGRAVLLALLLAAAFNWDNLITRYNLQQENPDIYYTMALLDNNLVAIIEAASQGEDLQNEEIHRGIIRRGHFLKQVNKQRDWRSWNWSTYRQINAWEAYQETN